MQILAEIQDEQFFFFLNKKVFSRFSAAVTILRKNLMQCIESRRWNAQITCKISQFSTEKLENYERCNLVQSEE